MIREVLFGISPSPARPKNRFWLWPDKLATVLSVVITVPLTALYLGTPGVESLTGSYWVILGVLLAVLWTITRSLSRAIWEFLE